MMCLATNVYVGSLARDQILELRPVLSPKGKFRIKLHAIDQLVCYECFL